MNKRLNAKVGAGVLLLAATGEAFGPACCGNKVRYDVFSRGTTTISHSTGVLLSKMDDGDSVAHDLGRRAFGAISAAALLGVKVSSAYAASSVPTSSMYIAEAVKTMDMSLPSYGSVIDPVSGASNVPTIDPFEAGKVGVVSKPRSTTPKKQPPAKKKAEKTSSSEGGGGGFSIGFPSMSSSSDKPKKEVVKKPKVEKPPKPEKEQEQKEKELVIVDTAMPSYSDSAATKEKSVFSL